MGRRETKILFDFVSRALRRLGPSLKYIMECQRGVTRNKTGFNPWFRCLSLVVNSELLVPRRKPDPTVNLRPEERNDNQMFKIGTDHISIAIPQSEGKIQAYSRGHFQKCRGKAIHSRAAQWHPLR